MIEDGMNAQYAAKVFGDVLNNKRRSAEGAAFQSANAIPNYYDGPKAGRAPEVSREILELHDQISRLQAAADEFLSRLVPVMDMSPRKAEEPLNEAATATEIGARIREAKGRVRRLEAIIATACEALEI
jgi:hypothetical protein